MSLQEARKRRAQLALAQRGSSAGFGGRIKEFGLQLESKGFAAEQVCWLAADGKLPAQGRGARRARPREPGLSGRPRVVGASLGLGVSLGSGTTVSPDLDQTCSSRGGN